jgi:hypothetical protein
MIWQRWKSLHVVLHVGEAADFAGKSTQSTEAAHAFVNAMLARSVGCAAYRSEKQGYAWTT